MPGRNYINGSSYRYGFNGKQKDDELYGDGNAYDFDARMYDPRIGRWLSVDNEAAKGPGWSPYNFAMNRPIMLGDPDGNWVEVKTTKYYTNENGEYVKKSTFRDIFRKTTKIQKDIIVHNAKVYNATNADINMQAYADDIKTKLMKAYNVKDSELSDKVIGHDEIGEPIYEPIGPQYEVTLNFAEPIQVVGKLSGVNASSDRPDNLFVIADGKQLQELKGGSTDADGFTTSGGNVIYLNSTTKDVVHEFAHTRSLDHEPKPDTMGQMYNNFPAEKEQIKNIKGGNESFNNTSSYKKLQKMEEQKTTPKK
jgi:RHS repeat-associated protein